jgi:hypothetical protein
MGLEESIRGDAFDDSAFDAAARQIDEAMQAIRVAARSGSVRR